MSGKISHGIDEFDSFFLFFPLHTCRDCELLPRIELIMMLVYISKVIFVLFSYVTSAVVTFSLFFSVLIFSASPGLLVS